MGVRCVIAFSAVGSLKEKVKPRDFVVVDQVVDWTRGVSKLDNSPGSGLQGTTGLYLKTSLVLKAAGKMRENGGP